MANIIRYDVKKQILFDKLKNPWITNKELAKKYSLKPIQVTKYLNSATWDNWLLDKIESELISLDMSVINKATELNNRYMDELSNKEELNYKDINAINDAAKKSFDRYQLIRGKATENVNQQIIVKFLE